MANPIQHAQHTLETLHAQIQPYMADLFYRLANNYILLLVTVFVVNMIGLPLLARYVPIPPSTVQVIGYSVMLLILVYGWRFLENRNNATALFVLYIRYSSQRRTLQTTLQQAEDDLLEDENTLYVHVDLLEETANDLLTAIDEQGLKAHRSEA